MILILSKLLKEALVSKLLSIGKKYSIWFSQVSTMSHSLVICKSGNWPYRIVVTIK